MIRTDFASFVAISGVGYTVFNVAETDRRASHNKAVKTNWPQLVKMTLDAQSKYCMCR